MTSLTIRWVVAFGIITVLGIVMAQSYWVVKIWNAEERKLNQQVYTALRHVADQLAEHYQNMIPQGHPVRQVKEDYYVVELADMVDAEVLGYYLKAGLVEADLVADYEYAIYDCSKDQMVSGSRVSILTAEVSERTFQNMPVYDQYTYYFGVYFPNKSSYVFSKMNTWFVLSAVLLMVVLFFGYTMMVILRQKRWSELQKDFINNMTHEFKTPIATINVSADVLQDPNIWQQPRRLQDYAQIIKSQSLRLNRQVEKVLQVAKLEQRALDLHTETLSLTEEVHSIYEEFEAHHQNQYDLQVHSANDDFSIEADPVHFRNVLHNLLDNAAKYSKPPTKILLSTKEYQGFVRMTIEDQGIGIPSEYISRIFHKFVRVPTGNQHDVAGFGLGLYYVDQICKLHCWKLNVKSELAKGTIFTIDIPLIA